MNSLLRDVQAKSVAQILLRDDESMNNMSSSNDHVPFYHTMSNPGIDLLNEDLIVGLSQNGRMSPVRRFFCLLVTFDLLFTSLLWLVFVMVSEIHGSETIEDALYTEVVTYNIKTSLFDLVMAAISRFTTLLLFYALLHIRNWSVVAITTTLTCAILIVKVFYYQWKEHNDTIAVMLVLVSFIISWGESWFLDFRVLPQEQRAREIIAVTTHSSHGTLPQVDRAPLLRPYLMSVNEEQTETVASFYSPLDTPHDSDEEADLRSRFLYRNSVSFDDEQYISKAKGAFEKAWRFVNEDGWHVEKTKDNGDVVCTRTVAKCKIYLFTGVIGVPVNVLVDELFTHVENIPSWNPNMMECKVIQEVDDQTKISYQVTNEVGKGVISSRDFVTVHRYEVRDGCHISAGIGVEHKLRPNLQKYIRAENGPSAWVIKPVSGDTTSCAFQWLLNTDLKGWIPQTLVDTSLSSFMFDYVAYLRSHVANIL